jgi:uncharacterized protein YkwD
MNRVRVLLAWLLLCLVLSASVQAEARENLIFINGQKLITQQTPFLTNNRVLVPFRAIFEAVGAEVHWDGNSVKITANKGQTKLAMIIGSSTASIDGQSMLLDVSPQIVAGRSFVPLRFVGEALGFAVTYDQASGWIFINQQEVDFGPQEARQQLALKNTVYGIKVGDSAAHVVARLGQPARRDEIDLGFVWWIYNQDYANYLQVGIKNNRVVALFTNAPSLQFNGLTIGSSMSDLTKQYSFAGQLTFTLQGATFRLDPVSKNRYLDIQGDTAYIFYMDIHQGNTLTAIRILNLETLILSGLYGYRYSFFEEPEVTRFVTVGSAIDRTNHIYALQIFDLTNVIRHRFGLPLLDWHQSLSQVASAHSMDMSRNNFFSHVSPATGSPHDRIQSGGIGHRVAGENIAAGQADAAEAVMDWMNSLGHRRAILRDTFQHLGVGVAGTRETSRYYTQKFIGN